MTNRDEITKSVDDLLAGWFDGERYDVDKNDIVELLMKHISVGGEPFGWIKPGAAVNDERYEYGMFAYRQQEDTPVPIFAGDPPHAAPSMAVKALADEIKKLEVSYHVGECMGLADWAAFEAGITKGLEAAAEKVSALSVQVQDVAGCLPEEVHEAATEVITAHECGMLRQTIWWETAAFLLAEYTMKAGDYAAAPAKQEQVATLPTTPVDWCDLLEKTIGKYQYTYGCGPSAEILVRILSLQGFDATVIHGTVNGILHAWVETDEERLDPTKGQFTDEVLHYDGHPAPSVSVKDLANACQLMADDYQTSDNHHPNHVLVSLSAFEAMRSALSAQVQDVAVAEIVSAHGDPEAFGERELVALIDIQKFPYRTKLYAAAPAKQETTVE